MVSCDRAEDGTYTLSGLTRDQVVDIRFSDLDDFEVEEAIDDQLTAERIGRVKEAGK